MLCGAILAHIIQLTLKVRVGGWDVEWTKDKLSVI